MVAFELGRLHVARRAAREWRGSGHLPLYAASLVAGIGIAVGAYSAADQMSFIPAATPSEVLSPVVRFSLAQELGEAARVVTHGIAGTLEAEALPANPEPAALVITVDAAPPAPVAVVDVAPAAPVAAIPLAPPQAETAPALVVPAAPVVPEVVVPEPVAPAPTNFYVPAVAQGPMTNLEQRLFDGLNAERVAAGLAPYTYDPALSTIARTRSQQMVDQGYFGHKDPYGYSMYVELLAHFGFTSYAWAGENLAVNNYGEFESPERAVVSLMKSPTHKSNILQTLFTRVGIGEVTHADGRKFYSMIFLG